MSAKDDKSKTLLDRAYDSALMTLARATLPTKGGEAPSVSPEQVKAATLIMDRYDKEAKQQAREGSTVPFVAANKGNGKVKLTDAGATALRAWAKRTGAGLGDLAETMGSNQMVPSRAMKTTAGGRGWLTLEQAGRLVAYVGGELTAEMLVGMAEAARIPVYPLRAQKAVPAPVLARAPVAAGPSAGGAGVAGAAPSEDVDGPPSLDELRRLGRKGLKRLEDVVDDTNSAATAASESAHRLVKSWLAAEEAEREREKGGTVKEVDLIQKFETLLFHAERLAAEAELAAAATVPAEPAKVVAS